MGCTKNPPIAKQLPLKYGGFALVDSDDLERIRGFKWELSRKGYVISRKMKAGVLKRMFLHRIINRTPRSMVTDHINGDKLDNRKLNLRSCSNGENVSNQKVRADNTLGFKGIRKNKRKWSAQIGKDGRHIAIGTFNTKLEAATAYDKAALRLHGAFASTNKMLGLLPKRY